MSDDFKDYLFEYRFGDSWWCITIKARSAIEARERIGALTFAQYCGEVKAKIPVPFAWTESLLADWARACSTLLQSLRRRL